ncbi:MAG: hypothetical protein ACREOO_02505 [bacterium]
MEDPRKAKWSGWIEVGQSTLQFIMSIIQLMPFVTAAAGIIFAYFSIMKWAIIFIGMAILFFSVYFIIKNVAQDRIAVLINPALWLERDELNVKVYANSRVVERRYTFKALKKSDRYRFKFRWSGSENVKVNLEASDDTLIRITSPKVQKSWHRYDVRFATPLRPGEKKTVILHYELPDRGSESEPYHLVSYAHVAGCSHLMVRLSFPDDPSPRDVFLIHYDADWGVQKGLPIGYDADDHEYRLEIKPETGIRYSLEWQEK